MALTVDSSSFKVYGPIGFDLSNYGEQLLHEREERTLNLRRNHFEVSAKKPHSWTSPTEAAATPEKVLAILTERSHEKLQLLNLLPRSNKLMITLIANDRKICEALIDCFSCMADKSSDDFVIIMNTISFLFPIACEENQITFADELTLSISSLLEEPKYVSSILVLINVLAKSSVYARNAITCFGIQTILIDLLVSTESDEIVNLCCCAISAIFANTGELDDSVIADSLDPVVQLLKYEIHNNNLVIIRTAIECLTYLIMHKSSITNELCTMGVCDHVIEYLDNQELVLCTLKFIGNIITSPPSTSQMLLKNGLFAKLMVLISNDGFTSDVFWILSNIMEIVPHDLSLFITQEFVASTLQLCSNTKFDIKKEAVYFLATCILFMREEHMKLFINVDIIYLIDEMISCGNSAIILRCIDAMFKLIFNFANDQVMPTILSTMDDCGMIQDLENLLESIEEDQQLSDRVSAITCQLQRLFAKYE